MQMTVTTTSWPINGSFTISRGSKTHADVVMVELSHNGNIGRGECVPYARYGESIEQVLRDLKQLQSQLNANTTHQDITQLLPAGAARNALDCAWWDLQCKQQHQSIWQLLDIKPTALTTAFTLSLDTPEKMGQAAKENQQRPVLKLKLAGKGDIARVTAVRENSPNAMIIVDANEGWDIDLYHQMIPQLVELNVAMIEQPFPSTKDHWLDGLVRPITICADESCHGIESLATLEGRYDMINIKLDKTGGLTQALALKQAAIAQGMQVMVGCMVGSSLGMAPAFVVAQGADIVDLDGPLLLAEDEEHGFEFDVSSMKVMSKRLWG
ncbi:N-acetyl-D-Glu racemase DgcA [Vibrio rumoiensis]|uniref:Dipeptide epimerase n=1 Tax=Vibrio rumoiensis 1S-45 TaxID=1188252 RepID=A0A1E5E4X2_9VIBR|nr:N-acetyl-D-Glu racemase DgcA [Vibrio rumoiensis]OEF28167.1 dipeptide epimerase [Vibrio rumoiensis 1S-45]